jgi:hypothetical protein
MYFVYRGFELSQKIYMFSVQAYANATGSHILVLRFPGSVPSKVLGSTMSSFSFDYGNGWEQVVFNAGTTDPVFTIIFNSGAQGLFNAAVVGSAFVPLIMISLGILFGTTMFARFRATITQTEPFVTVKQAFILGVVVIIGWLIVIIIASQAGGALKQAGA